MKKKVTYNYFLIIIIHIKKKKVATKNYDIKY